MTFRYTYNRGDTQTSPFGSSGSIRSTGSFSFGSSTLGTANTSRQRKPPERIQPNFFQDPEGGALSIAGRLIQTPGAALERPPALALNLAERALGIARQPGERSVLDRTVENIGKVGIGPLTIGGGVSAFTEGLGRVGNFTSSLMNAGDALVIRAVHDLPDDTPITEELLLRRGVPAGAVAGSTPYKEGVFLLGALNIPGTRGRNMTVGEYKASLEKRQWNIDPEDGTPLSWDEVARQVDEEGVNAFGNRAVNDSQIVDAAYRFSTDPLNLAFGLGAATKAANAARWAVSPAKRFLNAGSGLIPASWGVGASRDLAQIGLRASTYPSLGASVQALRNGNMAEATWQALGVALKTPKAIFLPGTGNLLTRYYRGGLRLQLGGTAVELGSGSLADMTRLGSDEDNIVSGAFAGLHDWSQAILNDHPIANDPLFTMVAAFGAPTVRVVKGDIAVTSQAVRTRLGSTTLRDWSRAFTEEIAPRSRLFDPDSPLGIARGRDRERQFLESIGGESGLNRLVGHARLAWAFKQYIVKNPDTRMRLESLDEMLHGSPQFRDLLDGIVTEGLRQNKIKDADLIQSFRDWANYRLSTMETEAGDLIPGMSERVAFDLSPKDMLDQWMEFSKVQDGMAARFQPIAGSLLARANRMTKEDLDSLGKAIRLVEQDGKVSSRFMISQLTKHQAMFDDPGVDTDFWRNLMNRGVAAKGTYDAELIISKLKELRDQAPARHELFHEKIRDESVAPVDTVSVGGPLSAQGIHPLYTPKILADARDRILPQMRVLTREIGEGQRRLDRRWNTRGNLKADAVLKKKAAGLMARTEKTGGASFDPFTGEYDTRATGYGTGAIDGTFAIIERGDVEGLRSAALRIATEYPDTNVGTWLNPKTDKIEVDPAKWFQTKEDAMAWAKAHNQKAVRDIATNSDIKVPGYVSRQVPEVSNRPANPELRQIADAYNSSHGLPPVRQGEYFKIDDGFGKRTAKAFDKMPAVDEAARPAYAAFGKETLDQWNALEYAGYKFEPWDSAKQGKDQPYANSDEMRADVMNNKHLYFFTGGEPHPFLSDIAIPGKGYTYNDIFRAVHDVMTHAQEGYQFGPRGELNAAIKHSQMYSPLARKAMLSETHGQNSWVNFHSGKPKGDTRTVAQINKEKPGTVYSDQKAALLPDEIINEFENRYVRGEAAPAQPEGDLLPASLEGDLLPSRPRLAYDQPAPAGPNLKAMLESERSVVNAKREQAKELKQELRAIERNVNDILTWRIDPSFRDTNGNPIVSGEDLFKLQEQTRWVDQNYPSLYQLERGPKLTTPWQPEDSFVTAMMQQRSNLATVLFDYGPLAKITHMLDFLTKPVNSSKMARDSRQAVFNSLLPFGFKPKNVDDFLSAMREAAELHRVGMVQAPLFRAMTALPASTINKLAHEHLRGTPEIMQAFAKKYGGTDRFHVMLDQSFNSLARRASDAILSGKKSDPLTRIFASGYWAFQRLPGLRSVSDGTRFFTKVMYPLLRFHADLRWQAQNVLEADTIAAAQDGFSATRMSHLPPSKVFHGKEEVNLSEQSVRILSERSKVSAGIPSEVTRQVGGVTGHELAEEIGAILPNARLWNVLRRQFDIQRPASTRKAIEALKNDDPLLVAINRRFGDDPMSIVDQLDDQLYGFNTKGVKATVQETVGRIAKQERWSVEELQVMQPFFNRLVDLHQGIFDDILQVHVGNVNRSRLERIMNSYWLYWPLSYQIKATKWLAGVLTDKAFGAQTNLGGLWTLNRAADQFKQQMVFNPDFRQQFKDHETIWFLAGMMFPITPFDLGVSLNRGVRYVGGNPAIGLWPEYTSIDNAGDFSLAMLKLGPIYSAELLTRGINEFTHNQEASEPTEPSEPPGRIWPFSMFGSPETESNDIPVPQY